MDYCTICKFQHKGKGGLDCPNAAFCNVPGHKPDSTTAGPSGRAVVGCPPVGQPTLDPTRFTAGPIGCPQDSKSLPQCGADLEADKMDEMLDKASKHEDRLGALVAIRDLAYSIGYRQGYRDAKDGE